MAYDRYEYDLGNAVEVEERHSFRHPSPGQPRAKSNKPTPEEMKKVNQRTKEKKCRRRMRKYFKENDLFVTLTYRKEERPASMEEAKKHFRDFLGRIRRAYKKNGIQMFWIRNIEVGSKGAWHIHLCINRIPGVDTGLLLAGKWPYGYVDTKYIRAYREFHDLATYMTKSPETETRLVETSYGCSRNMPLPSPKKTVMSGSTWRNGPMKKKGYELDKESYYEGINPVTGYPYRYYTLLRVQRE